MHGLKVTLRQDAPIALDVDFDCAPGELLALVGPSGSGKSTILRSIAGLYRPASGRVAINGEVWQDTATAAYVRTWQRHVGLVQQNYALFPHMTARANVAASLGELPAEKRASRADELMALVNLKGLEHRRPAELSGGQQQRVAVARALARNPKVLLLDEPFSAVDQVTRDRLKRELAVLRRTLNVPILLVTHDLQEAGMLADRIAVLHGGRLLMTGTPEEVRLRPSTATVAKLMGQTNLFDGTLEAAASDRTSGRLMWRGIALDVTRTGAFSAGQRVSWLAPADHVLLHRRARPVGEGMLNPVTGTVTALVTLGERTDVTLRVSGANVPMLNFNVSTRTVRNGDIAEGGEVTVSLLPEGIHLMPPED